MSDKKASSRTEIASASQRIVIKLGTAVLMREDGGPAMSRFFSFVESIADLLKTGREVLLVSSGAVGLGVQRLGLTRRPELLALKQACAAVGQGQLMALYSDAFQKLGVTTAQVLLTEEDFANRRRYLNLRSTITNLLELRVLPIINENDTVSTAELESTDSTGTRKPSFGDNDRLSALVASKIEADLLMILTDVEGLYTANPTEDGTAQLIPFVEQINEQIEEAANSGSGSAVGRGGMKTKLDAARIASRSGCATIIASGKTDRIISRIFAGEELGTLLLAQSELSRKRRWIAFASSVNAALVVNEGAMKALVERKASLLAAGVVEVRGDFDRADVVSILDEEGREFARGIVNYSSSEARKIYGQRSEKIDELIDSRNYDALITRDNIAFV